MTTAESANGQRPVAKKTILVVDDSRTMREHVRSTLEHAGYVVMEAEDGVEGLGVLRKQRDLALVLCDLQMPNMTGIQMVEALKNEGLLSNQPVVMLTTEGQMELIMLAKKIGVKGWIVQPFKAEQVVAAIAKVLR